MAPDGATVGKISWADRLRPDRAPGAGRRALFVGASLTPVMAIFIAFSILPIFAVIVFSFYRYSFSVPGHAFRGWAYYEQLGADPLFWNGLKRTALFMVIAVPLNILASLPVALGLQKVSRFKGTLRAFFFLPTVISTVAVSLLGLAVYDPSTGLLNQFLSDLHLPTGHWLSENNTAMPALVVLAVWQDMGYNVIIFLAGLQAIPPDFYEAARIDGAGRLSMFWHITVPLLQRTSSFTIILTVISYLQVFTYQQVMLAGGPDDSTRTISLYIYDIGIGQVSPLLSQAMAAAVVLLVVILAITLVQLRLARVEWDY
jgi:ABC-type sugar transport system permease subunit